MHSVNISVFFCTLLIKTYTVLKTDILFLLIKRSAWCCVVHVSALHQMNTGWVTASRRADWLFIIKPSSEAWFYPVCVMWCRARGLKAKLEICQNESEPSTCLRDGGVRPPAIKRNDPSWIPEGGRRCVIILSLRKGYQRWTELCKSRFSNRFVSYWPSFKHKARQTPALHLLYTQFWHYEDTWCFHTSQKLAMIKFCDKVCKVCKRNHW